MSRVLITGSTDGIGLQTAKRLAKLGFEVIIHGRNENRCIDAAKQTAEFAGMDSLPKYFISDFSSLSQVKNMAEKLNSEYDSIDVLINNAGIYMNELVLTEDGYETTFQVNHLAPFLLTNLLLPKIKMNPDSRIINVSSIAHTKGRIDFNNLNGQEEYDPYSSYAQSKLANVLFTYYLADQLESESVVVNCLHPGVISTKLLHTGFNITGASLEEGSGTSVYLAVSPEIKGITGKYFIDRRQIPSSDITYDKELQKKLWNVSTKLVSDFL